MVLTATVLFPIEMICVILKLFEGRRTFGSIGCRAWIPYHIKSTDANPFLLDLLYCAVASIV